jgi:hypothetical protein
MIWRCLLCCKSFRLYSFQSAVANSANQYSETGAFATGYLFLQSGETPTNRDSLPLPSNTGFILFFTPYVSEAGYTECVFHIVSTDHKRINRKQTSQDWQLAKTRSHVPCAVSSENTSTRPSESSIELVQHFSTQLIPSTQSSRKSIL